MTRGVYTCFAFFFIFLFGHTATIYVPDDYSSIQDAIVAASSGDTIIVRPGTHGGPIDFLGRNITLKSEKGPDQTMIDGLQLGSVVNFVTGENKDACLDGFTITNGTGALSTNLYGGGVYCYQSSPTICNNVITNNTAGVAGYGFGGGVACSEAFPAIFNNMIINNFASSNAGGIYVHSCPSGEKAVLNSNTIAGNSSNGTCGGIYCDGGGNAEISDSILWGNSQNQIAGPVVPTVEYCDVQGWTGGAHNIDLDPLFVNPSNGDYRLKQDPCQPGIVNPCVDAGDPNSRLFPGTTRTDGIQDCAVLDMGYHYPRVTTEVLDVPLRFHEIQDGIDASINGDTVLVMPDPVNGGPYIENIDFNGKAITVASEAGPRATTIDGNSAGSVVSFRNGEGRDSVLSGFTITNGTGTDIGNTLYGGGIISDNASPTIRGNIVRHNSAEQGGGIGCFEDASPLILNNVLRDNHANNVGGAIMEWANTNSQPTEVVNNIIVHNTADNWGGAIHMHTSSMQIICNTIAENTAVVEGGGVRIRSAHPTIVNTILWGNVATTGPQVYMDQQATAVVEFCDVDGGWTGVGNINLDPSFNDTVTDDFHLNWDSPCRDAGTFFAPGLPEYDFEGDHRIWFGVTDIGADEFQIARLYCEGDPTPGNWITFKVTGYPIVTPVMLGVSKSLRTPPLLTNYGYLYLDLPLYYFKPFGGWVPNTGIATTQWQIPPGALPGDRFYCQALVGPWGGPYYVRLSNLLTIIVE